MFLSHIHNTHILYYFVANHYFLFHVNLAELKPKKIVKKVAEGTSDYQAAWIIDSEGSEISDDSEESEEEDEHMSDENSNMDEDMDDMV